MAPRSSELVGHTPGRQGFGLEEQPSALAAPRAISSGGRFDALVLQFEVEVPNGGIGGVVLGSCPSRGPQQAFRGERSGPRVQAGGIVKGSNLCAHLADPVAGLRGLGVEQDVGGGVPRQGRGQLLEDFGKEMQIPRAFRGDTVEGLGHGLHVQRLAKPARPLLEGCAGKAMGRGKGHMHNGALGGGFAGIKHEAQELLDESVDEVGSVLVETRALRGEHGGSVGGIVEILKLVGSGTERGEFENPLRSGVVHGKSSSGSASGLVLWHERGKVPTGFEGERSGGSADALVQGLEAFHENAKLLIGIGVVGTMVRLQFQHRAVAGSLQFARGGRPGQPGFREEESH